MRMITHSPTLQNTDLDTVFIVKNVAWLHVIKFDVTDLFYIILWCAIDFIVPYLNGPLTLDNVWQLFIIKNSWSQTQHLDLWEAKI